jgi:general stress protein YciG
VSVITAFREIRSQSKGSNRKSQIDRQQPPNGNVEIERPDQDEPAPLKSIEITQSEWPVRFESSSTSTKIEQRGGNRNIKAKDRRNSAGCDPPNANEAILRTSRKKKTLALTIDRKGRPEGRSGVVDRDRALRCEKAKLGGAAWMCNSQKHDVVAARWRSVNNCKAESVMRRRNKPRRAVAIKMPS